MALNDTASRKGPRLVAPTRDGQDLGSPGQFRPGFWHGWLAASLLIAGSWTANALWAPYQPAWALGACIGIAAIAVLRA